MQINSTEELLQLIKEAAQFYGVIKDTGLLNAVGKDLMSVMSAVHRQNTEMDVAAFQEYTAAGMAPRDAVELLIARKNRAQITVNDLLGKVK